MKKLILAAVSTATMLALSACGESSTDESAEIEGTAEEEVAVDLPDTQLADDSAGTTATTSADGDTVSISADGVQADMNDGGTSVNANIGDDPSVTVKTN